MVLQAKRRCIRDVDYRPLPLALCWQSKMYRNTMYHEGVDLVEQVDPSSLRSKPA